MGIITAYLQQLHIIPFKKDYILTQIERCLKSIKDNDSMIEHYKYISKDSRETLTKWKKLYNYACENKEGKARLKDVGEEHICQYH